MGCSIMSSPECGTLYYLFKLLFKSPVTSAYLSNSSVKNLAPPLDGKARILGGICELQKVGPSPKRKRRRTLAGEAIE
jgi:hypothetical protein